MTKSDKKVRKAKGWEKDAVMSKLDKKRKKIWKRETDFCLSDKKNYKKAERKVRHIQIRQKR